METPLRTFLFLTLSLFSFFPCLCLTLSRSLSRPMIISDLKDNKWHKEKLSLFGMSFVKCNIWKRVWTFQSYEMHIRITFAFGNTLQSGFHNFTCEIFKQRRSVYTLDVIWIIFFSIVFLYSFPLGYILVISPTSWLQSSISKDTSLPFSRAPSKLVCPFTGRRFFRINRSDF